MAFKKKTWSDRMVEYAGRRKLTNVSTKQAIICDVERSEGTVSKEGDAFSSQNMNDLEQRVADGFSEVKQTTDGLIQNLAQGQIEFDVDAAGKGFYRKRGADTWVPFNRNLVLMNGTASYAYSGVSGTYAALFELDNFDFTNYRQISIKNLSNFSYEVTCGTKVFSSDGTYDISDLMAAKLRVMYHGNVGNPPIQLRIELIP
nr:MAG TPA: hypothetical protein [Caudoviricetes sp.]